ncbi:MAG: glutathione S-transferase family protein [Pseudomonadota bacterium]
MPDIQLYELSPTRSVRCHWTLAEAGLAYTSLGNEVATIHSDAVKAVHPLGKLPAALIDGRPLFESAAICTAIADLVPEQGLVAPSGSWARALHDQWVCFALTELEAWVWSSELNSDEFILPADQHVTAIIAQNTMWYRRGADVLEQVLQKSDYLVDNRFSVTDIIVSYTVNWGHGLGWLEDYPQLQQYLQRLRQREHCTLPVYT